jgi:prolyl-tRNA synthetase
MRWSRLFIPTLRDDPADADVVSHRLLVRAGYVRQLGAGIYSYLYLAQRSLLKITQIVREEMDRIGAQEFYLPALNPAEVWQESGRYAVMGDNLFRLKDRTGRDLCLGMTHEEVMTTIARSEVRSYKQLPQIWYQIQTKFRDEPRPRSGLLRTRQFIMKDSYSFDVDEAGLDTSYNKHRQAYCKAFDRCGLNYVVVRAHSGAMGGSQSEEFMVLCNAGEDLVATCASCQYAANLEKATSRLAPVEDGPGPAAPERFATPGKKTIDEVAAFDGLPESSHMKTLIYMVGDQPWIILLRGNHQLSEAKLESLTAGAESRPAHPHEISELMGANPGSLGPIGLPAGKKPRIVTDLALQGRKNLVAGANEDDFHLKGVEPGRDFATEYFDLRVIEEGQGCPQCGAPLAVSKAIEIGHIFKLGYKYSNSMGARVLGEKGQEITPIMGSYGIGMERILVAAVEQNNDANGMSMPMSIAPFAVVITPVNVRDASLLGIAERIYQECLDRKLDALLDDRDERPGVKFKDADLIGVPWRVTVGRQAGAGIVEVTRRSTGQRSDVNIADVAGFLAQQS